MKTYHVIAFTLLLIGGLNWLLVGFLGWGIGNFVGDVVGRIIYVLVGAAAIYEIATHKQTCKLCGMGSSTSVGGPAI